MCRWPPGGGSTRWGQATQDLQGRGELGHFIWCDKSLEGLNQARDRA